MITVYRYRLYDPDADAWVVQLSKATAQHIAAVKGRIIDGTAEEVDDSAVDAEGYFAPAWRTQPN
jgi:hypothetical protein